MLQFLHGQSILSEAKHLIEQGERIDLAVAYWGRDAAGRLGIDAKKPTRILCDLTSGGCNPNEIETLRSAAFRKNVEVRDLQGLHAKVYLSPASMIVGSANASANGLGDEHVAGTIEAAIRTDDAAAIGEAAAWFEDQWGKARKINRALLDQAREAWLRRIPRPAPGETVLDKFFADPEWFRDRVWLIHYVTDASEAAIDKFEEVKARYYSPHQLEKFGEEDPPLLDLETADVPPVGDSVVDLRSSTNYEILQTVPYSRKHSAVLLKPVKDVQGLALPRDQKRLLRNAIKAHLENEDVDGAWNLQKLPEDAKEYLAANFVPQRN